MFVRRSWDERGVRRAPACAKLNLALLVGPRRADGAHEVATVLQRVDLADRISISAGRPLSVRGFVADTLVRRALERLAEAAGVEPRWSARIDKRIPVAAGLGGGSSDAATALRLANETLERPLPPDGLRELAATLGADVPFFLAPGPQLGEGDGTQMLALDLPQDYWVVLWLPHGAVKTSTADVYRAFDRRRAEHGFAERRSRLEAALREIRYARDLASLPLNDLASSAHTDELHRLGAFRADVTGAGPTLYGLFAHLRPARAAARRLRAHGRTWLTLPAWYF